MAEPVLYNTSQDCGDDRSFKNYGKRWTDEEKDKLAYLFQRARLPVICRQLERPKSGVLAKLCEAKLIHQSYRDGKYYRGPAPGSIDVLMSRQAGKSTLFAHPYGTSETTASTMTVGKPRIRPSILYGGQWVCNRYDTNLYRIAWGNTPAEAYANWKEKNHIT